MPERIEGAGVGPPEPPERAGPPTGPVAPERIGAVSSPEPTADVSPVAAEVQRVLTEAAQAGVDDRQACERLVNHLIEGWISDGRREEVAKHISEMVVQDPVFSRLLSRLRHPNEPPASHS